MSSRRLLLAGLAGFASVAALLAIAALAGPPPPPPPPAVTPDASSAAPSPSAAPAATSDAPTPEPQPFGVGAPAPGLSLRQLGGGLVDLGALAGKPVWVQFTATWCPSCRDDASAMTSFASRYRDTGLVVLAVDVREDETTVATFAKRNAGDYPIALDEDGAAARSWGVLALPTHFFIDANGIVRAGAVGTVGRDVIARNLMEILPGVTVVP